MHESSTSVDRLGSFSDAVIAVIITNFLHLFAVSLIPFATAWVARSQLAPAPVAVYGTIFFLVDLAYLVFERAVFAQADAALMSDQSRKRAQIRTLVAIAIFAAAAITAPFMPLLGFAMICFALVLYASPEAISKCLTMPRKLQERVTS